MEKIRTLKADEIEVRMADRTKDGKVHLLLYINSRAATALLDSTYGMENWNLEYKDVAGQIYGRLSIWDKENQRYVYREDTGSEANIEADKSLASDILKRLIVRLGVSELYSTPKIYVEDDGYGCSGYRVEEIEYDDNRNITHLVLTNRFGKEMYRWDKNNPVPQTSKPKEDPLLLVIEEPIESLKKFFASTKNSVEGKEQEELVKFKDYYKSKLEKGEWKGTFRPQDLWIRWRNKNVQAA